MSVLTCAQAVDLLDPVFRKIIYGFLDKWPAIYPKYMRTDTSTKNIEKDSAVSGIGGVALKGEGKVLQFDTIFPGYDKTYTHETWGLGIRVTMEMYQDDQHRIIKRLPEGLARSCAIRVETSCANLLNRAFSGSFLGPDGVSLCSTAHPILEGGTQSNRAAADAALTFTSLTQSFIDMDSWVNERHQPVRYVGKRYLHIHPAKQVVAYELLQSPNKPYTANNDKNFLNRQDIEIVLNPFLSTAYPWFITSEPSSHEMWMFWRMKPKTEMDGDFKTKDILNTIVMRFSCGWSHWVGVYGSNASS